MTPTILWALLSVIVIVIVVAAVAIVVARSFTASRARVETLHVLAESASGLSLACRLEGHVYRKVDTSYHCATCGSQVDRAEGARYVLNEARRGGDIAAIVEPDQVPLIESGMRAEHHPRVS